MKLLILGGTLFVGRAVAEAALERGHELTLFHRGRTNPGLFPDVEHLHGDRDGDLSALEGRSFDAVIDTSGYVPRVVRASAELLAGSVDRYVFVSTISVYANLSTGPSEESPRHRWDGGTESVVAPLAIGGFAAMRALSTRNDDPQAASRPWDKDRDGFVLGEGSGVLILEEMGIAMGRTSHSPIFNAPSSGRIRKCATFLTRSFSASR